MFECEEDIHGLGIFWEAMMGQTPDRDLIRTLCFDALYYGYSLVGWAIRTCSGSNVKNGKCNPRDIYEEWLEAALGRDWIAAERICKKAGYNDFGIAFVPYRLPDLLYRYYEIKFGENPDDEVKDQLFAMASDSSVERVVYYMSLISPQDFSMEILRDLFYSNLKSDDSGDYFVEYEQDRLCCSTCETLMIDMEENYPNAGLGRCYRCGGEVETHLLMSDWSDNEVKLSLRVNEESGQWSCEYCPRCRTHYFVQNLEDFDDAGEYLRWISAIILIFRY